MKSQVAYDSRQDEREFVFTDRDFRTVAKLVHDQTGIALSDHKRELVYSRLARRLRALRLRSFSDYLALLEAGDGGEEIGNFINAITTNLTRFFRETHHFDHLRQHVLEPAVRSGRHRGMRIWSAGCSTGEEPYSIAMTVASCIGDWSGNDIRVLATDLDTNVLATARAGHYRLDSLTAIPENLRKRYVRTSDAAIEIEPDLRRMIAFKQLNLLNRWPLRRQYDAIFCRNVLIYFDAELKARIISGYRERLKIGGFLYIGHSESAHQTEAGLRLVGRTTYERIS